MNIKAKVIDKFKRITRTYEGNIYELNENEKINFTRKNIENKVKQIEKFFYKRSIFTDLYVVELNTKKRIPTLVKNKLIRIPSKKFVIIEKKGLLFNEKQIENKNIKKTYKINEKNNGFLKSKKILNTIRSKTLEIIKNIIGKKYDLSTIKLNLNNIKLKVINKLIEKKNHLFQKKDKAKKVIQEIKLLGPGKKNNDKASEKNTNNEVISENQKTNNTESIINSSKKDKNEISEIDKEKVIDVDYKVVDSNVINKNTNKNVQIEELKKIKNEILCDYWMKKQYPKKDIIVLNKNNDIEEIAKEMISLSNDNNIVKQTLNNIKLSTQLLKTEKEIITYYNYKLTGNKELFTEDVKTNCYKMLRADRKLKK